MLIKKIHKLVKNWRDNIETEILFRFFVNYKYFFAIRFRNKRHVTFIVSEYYDDVISKEDRNCLRNYMRSDYRFVGRRIVITC